MADAPARFFKTAADPPPKLAPGPYPPKLIAWSSQHGHYLLALSHSTWVLVTVDPATGEVSGRLTTRPAEARAAFDRAITTIGDRP